MSLVAVPSLRKTTRKSCWAASRAVVSQQMLVAMPLMITASVPRSRSCRARSVPWKAPSAVVPQMRPQCGPAGRRAGADADPDAGPVVLHVVRGVVRGQQTAAGEVRPEPAERVDGEHGAVGGVPRSPHPVGVVAGEHRWQAIGGAQDV